jgi:hypothetical protein
MALCNQCRNNNHGAGAGEMHLAGLSRLSARRHRTGVISAGVASAALAKEMKLSGDNVAMIFSMVAVLAYLVSG